MGSREETRRFYMTEYDQVASLREDWEGIRVGDSVIEISTLDIQIKKHGLPDYCKIDVEGWELEVMQGLSQAIRHISFEYHLSESEIQCALSVLERIGKLGSYHCNMKEASSESFALPGFIPLEEFRERFPHRLGVDPKDGYGDIFCTLDPTVFLIG